MSTPVNDTKFQFGIFVSFLATMIQQHQSNAVLATRELSRSSSSSSTTQQQPQTTGATPVASRLGRRSKKKSRQSEVSEIATTKNNPLLQSVIFKVSLRLQLGLKKPYFKTSR